jgi:tetratricopeptide (TPR) repeat protein/cold shock CspA family protein
MPASGFPYDVFISYSHADQDWVRNWLVARLKAAGLRVCVDYESFDVGVPSVKNMERAVEQSRKTVLVLTPDWTESDWTDFESLLAQTDDPSARLRQMLPLMLKPCTPRKGISIHTSADFTDPEHWEEAFGLLIQAINDEYNLSPAIDVPRFTASYRVPFLLPQLDVPTFSGRVEELTKLEDLLLRQEGAKVCSIVGLAGAGGIGKSALACHFAELHREDFADGVIGLRVDGKDADTLAREFARHIEEELDPEDERDAATIMQEVFGHRRMLLIFDNADDAGVASLRPGSETCAVIVTTRDRQLPFLLGIPEEGRIDLSPLPYEDALLLLKRLLGEARVAGEQRAAEEIIELVGGLPLALQIVGATLQMQAWRALENYVNSLREERERLSRLEVRRDSNLNVRASFSLSLNLLTNEEVDFFACLSVCAQDGFSVQAATAAGGCEESTAHERLGYLYRLSLLNLSQSGTSRFVFHPLIRLFAQELAGERSLRDGAAERHAYYFVELVKSSDPDNRATAKLLAAELDDILLAAQWLLQHEEADYGFVINLEPFLQQNGHWQQAIELMSAFLALAERGEDWNASVQLRIQQAKFLSLRGEWAQAEDALVPIPSILERIEPEYSQSHLEAMWLSMLGGVQQQQGHFLEALDTFQRSYVIIEKLNDERGMVKILTNLGGVLQRLGRFDSAVDILRRSVVIEEQINNKPGQAKVLTSLGGVLQRLGRFDEAAKALRQGAAIEEQLGNQRGQAIVLNSLGGVYQRQGHFDEAVKAFKRSYDLLTNLGDLRGQAMVLNSLGGTLQRQGHFEEAVDIFRRSIAIGEQLNNQRGLAMVLNSLGGVLQRMGRFDEAADAFQRSYNLLVEQGDRRGQAMVLNSLGGVLQRMGRFDEALEILQRAQAISEQLADKVTLSQILNSLGGVLQRMGRFDEATDAFKQSYDISKKLEDKRSIAMSLNSLGGVLQRMGRFDEAANAFRQSIAIEEQLADLRGQAMVLNSLGGVLQRMGRFDEAVDAFERSYNFLVEQGDRRGQAMLLNSLGGVFERLGRFDEALDAFRRSIRIGEELGDKRHLAMVHTALGKALLARGEVEGAVGELRQGFAIDEGLRLRRGLCIVTPALGRALVRLGRREEALEYCGRALAVAPAEERLLALREQLSDAGEQRDGFAVVQGMIKVVLRHSRGYRFGFITPDDGSADIYFREGFIDPECLSRLAKGIRVEVQTERAHPGPRAKSIRIIE